MFSQKEKTFKSSRKNSSFQAYIWEPDQLVQKKAIIQICHGAAEHSLRYHNFAKFLAENGYVVIACDYLGHGKSANGHFGFVSQNNGHKILAKDTFLITEFAKNEYHLPIIIIGFGVGSLIARYTCSLFGIEYDAAIFMGTFDGSIYMNSLARILPKNFKNKKEKEARLISKLSTKIHNRNFKNSEFGNSYLTRDENEVKIYESDPLCGFPLTYSAYRDILRLSLIVNSKKWAEKMPKNIPIYLISGLEDPLGHFGRGVIKIYGDLVESGSKNIEIKLYEYARHCLLFELNKDEVYSDILNWIGELEAI